MTAADLAARLRVNPKTVDAWLVNEGRAPHPRTRWEVAELLGVDEMELWPNAVRDSVKVGPDREIVRVYPTHASVPDAVWQRLIGQAKTHIDLCGFAPYWLTWQVPRLAEVLRERAGAGCRIRVVLGDPSESIVAADERATGVALTITQRIEQTLLTLAPLADDGVLEVRQSVMGYGRSVYRGDDELIFDFWLHGMTGQDFPAQHLRRRQDDGMFDRLTRHVQALWDAAAPLSQRV